MSTEFRFTDANDGRPRTRSAWPSGQARNPADLPPPVASANGPRSNVYASPTNATVGGSSTGNDDAHSTAATAGENASSTERLGSNASATTRQNMDRASARFRQRVDDLITINALNLDGGPAAQQRAGTGNQRNRTARNVPLEPLDPPPATTK